MRKKIISRLNGVPITINKNYLALYSNKSFRKEKEEYIPENLEVGRFYKFKLEGCQIFPIGKTITLAERLFETMPIIKKDIEISPKPLARIQITNANQYQLAGNLYTSGEYYIKKVL